LKISKISRKKAKELIETAETKANKFFVIKKNEYEELKIVVSVKKAFFKRAVKRNYIKRIIREIIRKNVNYKAFFLVIIRKPFSIEAGFSKIEKSLKELL
jgi:ribonuclease P protein component